MAYYLTDAWANLSQAEQQAIGRQAKKVQDRAERKICLWCGEPLHHREYELTGSKPNQREICKDYCKRVRFFDMPKRSNAPATHPLSTHPSVFVGYEPIAVIFGNESIPAASWKEVYQTILQHCIQDFTHYERLIALKRSISTQQKPFLSSKPDEMTCPVEICEDLYAESDYSFHILLQLLTDRILKPIKFSIYNIKIMIK